MDLNENPYSHTVKLLESKHTINIEHTYLNFHKMSTLTFNLKELQNMYRIVIFGTYNSNLFKLSFSIVLLLVLHNIHLNFHIQTNIV